MKKLPSPIYYYISFLLAPLLGLLQTKVLTNLLPLAAFGEIQVVLPVLAWITLIGGLGTPQYVIRYYCRDGENAYEEALFTSAATIFIIGLIGCTLIFFFSPSFGELNLGFRMVLIFLFAASTQHIVALVKAYVRVMERHVFYNIIVIVAKIFHVTGVIICVVAWPESPSEGFLLGTAISSIPLLLLVAKYLKAGHIWKMRMPSGNTLRQIFSYGLPIVCIMLMGELLPNLNRYVILAELDSRAVAQYVIGLMIATLCFQTLYEPLNTILHPPAFRAWEKNCKAETCQMISKYLNIYVILGAIVCGLSIRLEDILTNFVANVNYRMPAGCFTILLVSCFFLGIYRFLSIHYYLERNTLELGLIFLLSIVVNFLTAIALISKTGLMGACLSFLFGALVLAIAVLLRAQKNLKIRLSNGHCIIALTILFLFAVLPTSASWEIYSPLRWVDAFISMALAGSFSYILVNNLLKESRCQ